MVEEEKGVTAEPGGDWAGRSRLLWVTTALQAAPMGAVAPQEPAHHG